MRTLLHRKYYENSFQKTLQTTIVSKEKVNGQYHLVLADTIFYPTGGGQPHDTGWIHEIPVVDVYEEGGTIYHVVEKDIVENQVLCTINWDRRLYHMEHHTGQHVLSAVFLDQYGCSTEGFHLGKDYCTIDITTSHLSERQQTVVEDKVNALIKETLPVKTYLVTPEELGKLPICKAPTVSDDIRIVEISGFDYSPCCGTHLTNTGQIGLLKILKTEKYKGMTRVYFVCGTKALSDYVDKHSIITDLCALFSVPEGELPPRAAAEMETKRELEKELKELQGKILKYKAKEIAAQSSSSFIKLHLAQGSLEDAQYLAHHIMNLGSYTVLITVGERLVLAHNGTENFHCGNFVKTHALPLGGRGGGSAQSAQVFFSDAAAKDTFTSYVEAVFRA